MAGKRIVFTGGSGKAGRHAVPHLLAKGYTILNVDLKPLDLPGVNTLIADLTDTGQAFNALTSHFGFNGYEEGRAPSAPDAVVHFAAIPRVLIEPDNVTFAANVTSTYNVIEAAMKLGVRKVIIASSETTYGVCFAEGDKDFHSFPLEEDYDVDPMDSYGLSKVCNEKTARAFAMRYGADIYALRIGNVIEPHEYGMFEILPGQSDDAQAQRLELHRRARPRRDRPSLPGEGRARLPGVQRNQRHDHPRNADAGIPVEDLPARADHPAARRLRGAAVEPQGARGAGLQGGAQLAQVRQDEAGVSGATGRRSASRAGRFVVSLTGEALTAWTSSVRVNANLFR